MLNQTKKNWEKTANIANKYGKDGCISALKEAIDNLLIQQRKAQREKQIAKGAKIHGEMIVKALKQEREDMIKVIEEIYACNGGDDCKCNTEMGKNISTSRHSMKMQIIKALKDE